MNVESYMRAAVHALQQRWGKRYIITGIALDAVVDGPAVGGKLPDNPDRGAGTEPGVFTIEVYTRKVGSTEVIPAVVKYDEHAVKAQFTAETITVDRIVHEVSTQIQAFEADLAQAGIQGTPLPVDPTETPSDIPEDRPHRHPMIPDDV